MTAPIYLRIRPARLGSALANLSGASRRRFVRTPHGTFYVNPVSVGGSKISRSEFEPSMRSVVETYLKPGGVFVDLGANEGYFSVLASKRVGNSGSVISVEPQSRLQSIIQSNLAANKCFNVRVFQCVLSDRDGALELSLASDLNTGASSLTRSRGRRTEQVQSYRLESFLDNVQVKRCDLMKVDIEGAEYEVFTSATAVLKSGRIRNIALEIHNSLLRQRGLSGETLHQHLLSCGYRLNDRLGNWVYTFA